MFIRHYFKQENGQRTAYWALVESHRTATGPRQRVVAWLGKLDEAGRLGVKLAAEDARRSSSAATDHHTQPLNTQQRFEFDDGTAATLSAGCYLLRTNVADWSDGEHWRAYIQLTEAEAAFRIHKSDLSIRPIRHTKEERVLAHIFVCFPADVL